MTAHVTSCDWTAHQKVTRPSRIRSLFAALMHEIEIRRALRNVSSLDDAMLHDIGLTPGNIEDAVRYGRH
ncbi:DUF1127 domain-containing protein [Microvirga mediterraneensis]|uniref:DUF1127 domain-containing protein n=1 Tax=Microvirga mediterraneensis TaxID=2754695 RepID=A0A838BTF4_9HYPH|nr:DUF1127 domain-containing protein [Microvirga mediterraneensis]MBA1158711.1 DUF1127 domain-containing protein [Microvirga mediterraneensis]